MKQKITGVSYMEITGNRKTGPIAATYVAQGSCPETCPFIRAGCYAETGKTGCQTHRLNGESRSLSPEQLARNEAWAIRSMTGERPLRLHVVGDCRTDSCAAAVSSAAAEYTGKHDQVVYGYTHSWREVLRSMWGKVSMLASCETFADIKHAWKRGYAASIVLPKFRSEKAWNEDGAKIIPCPQQTGRAKDCASCKLCFKDSWLRESRSVIAFRPDGTTGKRIENALIQIEQKVAA